MRRAFLIAVMSCLLPAWAGGDVLVLGDKETLTGNVVRIEEGTLVFRTSLAGQMMVPMDTVHSISTERNFVITLSNGDVHYGKFASGSAGETIVPLNGEAAQAVTLAEVTEALAIPGTPRAGADDAAPRWRATGETGLVLRDTNRESVEASARIELRGELERSRVEGSLSVSGDDLDKSPNQAGASVLLRDSVRAGIKPYGEARLERDVDRGLDLQVELSLGLWDYLHEGEKGQLEWFAGLNLTYEDWDASEIEDRTSLSFGPGEDERAARESNLQLRLRYSRAIFHGSRLDEDLVLYPSVTDVGDFRARYETSVSVPLATKLRLRLNLRLDFDSDPELDGLDNWGATVGAGFQWDF